MRLVGVLVLLIVAGVSCVTPPPPGILIPVNGTASWTLGVNYPWRNYGTDFGSNAWGYSGVAAQSAQITTDFTAIHSHYARVIRWWLFTDGRAGITFDSTGKPTALDPKVFDDITAAVTIAKRTNTFLVLSLFDFYWLQNPSTTSGVTMGGHTDTLTDSTKLNALLSVVINPILTRFKGEKSILAYEIMNEPEWVISDLPQPSVNSNVKPVTLAQFFNFASAISRSVHTYADQYVTLGSASLKWYRVWTPAFATQKALPALNLDFYQTHYYSWMDPYCSTNDPYLGTVCYSPLKQNVTLLKLDRPMVVGEFPASTNAAGLLDQLLKNQYAGAWPWSFNKDYQVDWTTYQQWGQAHNNIIHWQ